jgi:ribosomal protein S12 methylthiotransferase
MPRVFVVSLGCAKNQVDTEAMLGYLLPRGCTLTKSPRTAHLLLVNTCAFIRAAETESWDHIRALAAQKRPGQRLIVCGCLPARYTAAALQLEGVDAWLGVRAAADVARHVQRWFVLPPAPEPTPDRIRITPRHYAYLRIADGCHHRCAYCTIPRIRGAFASRPLRGLLAEAQRLADSGVRELNLIAQDTTSYGSDLRPRRSLAELVERLCTVTGIDWVRVQYLYPSAAVAELCDLMATEPKVCRYFDMPLQHIADSLLRSMRRPRRAATERLLARIRDRLGDPCLRTTFIVGYPGETAAEFSELLAFVRETRFQHVGVFAYSSEAGTPAYRLGDPVPTRVKTRRRNQLLRVQQGITLARNQAYVGTVMPVLIDRVCGTIAEGRRAADAPDVDNCVHVRGACRQLGKIVPVRITRAAPYDLFGRIEPRLPACR